MASQGCYAWVLPTFSRPKLPSAARHVVIWFLIGGPAGMVLDELSSDGYLAHFIKDLDMATPL